MPQTGKPVNANSLFASPPETQRARSAVLPTVPHSDSPPPLLQLPRTTSLAVRPPPSALTAQSPFLTSILQHPVGQPQKPPAAAAAAAGTGVVPHAGEAHAHSPLRSPGAGAAVAPAATLPYPMTNGHHQVSPSEAVTTPGTTAYPPHHTRDNSTVTLSVSDGGRSRDDASGSRQGGVQHRQQGTHTERTWWQWATSMPGWAWGAVLGSSTNTTAMSSISHPQAIAPATGAGITTSTLQPGVNGVMRAKEEEDTALAKARHGVTDRWVMDSEEIGRPNGPSLAAILEESLSLMASGTPHLPHPPHQLARPAQPPAAPAPSERAATTPSPPLARSSAHGSVQMGVPPAPARGVLDPSMYTYQRSSLGPTPPQSLYWHDDAAESYVLSTPRQGTDAGLHGGDAWSAHQEGHYPSSGDSSPGPGSWRTEPGMTVSAQHLAGVGARSARVAGTTASAHGPSRMGRAAAAAAAAAAERPASPAGSHVSRTASAYVPNALSWISERLVPRGKGVQASREGSAELTTARTDSLSRVSVPSSCVCVCVCVFVRVCYLALHDTGQA